MVTRCFLFSTLLYNMSICHNISDSIVNFASHTFSCEGIKGNFRTFIGELHIPAFRWHFIIYSDSDLCSSRDKLTWEHTYATFFILVSFKKNIVI